ncbi:MAG: hypothetical protein IIX63_01225, partial [Treponema sp.]|nr:hypothetical protein [Treponema sp.]
NPRHGRPPYKCDKDNKTRRHTFRIRRIDLHTMSVAAEVDKPKQRLLSLFLTVFNYINPDENQDLLSKRLY